MAAGRTPPSGGGGVSPEQPQKIEVALPPALGSAIEAQLTGGTQDPDVVYVTTVGYPGSVLLLFHADGRVSWK